MTPSRNTAYLARSPFDSALSGLAGSLAVYSMFMSVNKPTVAQYMAAGVMVSTFIGFLLSQAFKKSPVIKADGWFLTFVAGVLLFVTNPVNASFGDDAIPINLIAGLYFSLLLLVGSMFAWRDPTMLMLSVPCISLFAYVGVFDYWRPAIVLFFIFLIAIAVLYARAFLRVMVERAERLGADPQLLRRDVWKWVAGPEWAFASAAVVIAISLVAGPLLQISLAPVSGAVKLPAPTSVTRTPTGTNTVTAENRVGVGPVNLGDTPVFKVKSDEGGYFRRKAYFEYNGDGWNSSRSAGTSNSLLVATKDPSGGTKIENSRPSPYEEIDQPRSQRYTLQFSELGLPFLPEPGVVTHIDVDPIDLQLSGPSIEISAMRKDTPITFDVDKPGRLPGDTRASVPGPFPSRNPTTTTDRVKAEASEAVKNAKTDYQKCIALMRYLGNRCKYNTAAAAVPAGKDKVDYFLNEGQEGYCDLFATSFVVMARSVGIQARYATGWYLNIMDRKSDNGWYTVVERDGHAWAEVYFRGVGWVPFDATATAVNISPEQQKKETSTKSEFKVNWEAVWAGVMVVGGLLVAGFVGRALWKQRLGAADPVTQLARVQNRFQFAVEGVVKHPRRFSQSITEFTHRYSAALGEAGPPANDLAKRFEHAFFSPEPVDAAVVASIQVEANKVIKQLAEVKKTLGRSRPR